MIIGIKTDIDSELDNQTDEARCPDCHHVVSKHRVNSLTLRWQDGICSICMRNDGECA